MIARTSAVAALLCGIASAQSFEGLDEGRDRLTTTRSLFAQTARAGADDRLYDRGTHALDKGDYAAALEAFTDVANRKGTRADGALYWKAYSLNRLGRRDEAMKALAELRSAYASSRWQNDARALDLEIRQSSGQNVSPASQSNEDLKLVAINGLMQSDPDRALPILEGLLRSSNASPRVKDRAIFVLAQSPSPRGRQALADIARGANNPDLQLRALSALGTMGGKEGVATLASIYAATSDAQVKSQILKGFMMAGAHDQLLNAAKNEKSPELRGEAIRQLSMAGGQEEVWQLYQGEHSVELREQMLHSFMLSGQSAHLNDVLRSEHEPRLRRAAIRTLGMMGPGKTDQLVPLYSSEQDPETRKEILNALFISQNAKGLIELARTESDTRKKQDIVQKLSMMHSKETTDYMLELLK